MPDEQTAFLELLAERLGSLGVPYMLTGSVALTVYAEPRMTRDIDLVVDLGPGQVDAFVGAFTGDCYVDRESVAEAVAQRDMFNVIHGEWILKADFVVRKDEPYRIEELARRRAVPFGRVTLSVVAPEDLLLSKLVWGRSGSEVQLRDVQSLLRSGVEMDADYVAKWAERLGVTAELERARSTR